MNVLGVGGPELVIVLILMLIIAGPKRMIHWSYVLGQYVAKFRRMWAETVDVIQQEFDDAGVGVKLPREMPTRGSLNREVGKAMSGITAPVKETMDQVNSEIGTIKTQTSQTAKAANNVARGTNGHSVKAKSASTAKRTTKPATGSTVKPAASDGDSAFGSWSTYEDKPDFGAWSDPTDDKE